MAFFPAETHSLQYVSGHTQAMLFLTENTKESGILATERTQKLFIGTVTDSSFTIISSVPGIGAFTVLKGELKPSGGTLKIEVNRPFRILIYILAALVAAVILLQVITHFELRSIGYIVPALMFFFIGRFMVRRAFKTAANLATRPLYRIFSMTEIQKPA